MDSNLQCPVDRVLINENKARIIAFFVLIIAVTYLVTGSIYLIAFLIPDFLLRATAAGKYSPLGLLADFVVKQFKIKNKPTDRGPKRFAAGTGLVFSLLILSTAIFHLAVISIVLAVILACFAALESFVAFCAGCYVYTQILRFS